MTEGTTAEIDAHMLIGQEPAHWRELALGDARAIAVNLREPADAADTMPPIQLHLHILAAIAGDLCRARRCGFGAGNAPYMTFFDPDDRYPVKAASAFLREGVRVMQSDPEVLMCYSLERRIDERGHIASFVNRPALTLEEALSHSSAVHGMQLWRRDAAIQALEAIKEGDQRIELSMRRIALSSIEQLRCIPLIARHWRAHQRQHSMAISTRHVKEPDRRPLDHVQIQCDA